MAESAFDAIVLAGGAAARLGGADKPGLVVGACTLVAAVTGAAVTAGARQVVLVGPERADLAQLAAAAGTSLVVVREDPPGGGPVPALRAGLSVARAPWVTVLAADLPFLRACHLRDLLTVLAERGEQGEQAGAVMADGDGRPQWLTGCWRTGALRSAAAAYGGSSLRGLLGPLDPVLVGYAAAEGAPPPWLDCDTPAQLAAARSWPQAAPRSEPGQRARQGSAGGRR